MSASLQGTLTGDDVLLQMEALRQAQAQALAQHTAEATSQAQGAAEQYAQAAQAPPPDIAPLAALLNTIQGSVSSILSGDKGFQQRAEERTQDSRAGLLKARADNLRALQDVYKQKAEEAQKAGDLEQTEKYRRQFEMLSKQFEVVSANQKRTQAQEDAQALEATRQANRLALKKTLGAPTPKEKPTAEDLSYLGSLTTTLPDGRKFLDLGGFAAKEKAAARQWAVQNNVLPVEKEQAFELRDIQGAKLNLKSLFDDINGLLPKDAATRAAAAPGIKLSRLLQISGRRAAYATWRTSAIKALRATTGSKSFRMTQQEVNLAIKNDIPELTDTYEVALDKLQRVGQLLDNAQAPILDRAWAQASLGGPGATPAPTGGTKVKMRAPDGKLYNVDSGEADEAKQNGWKVAP